MFKNKQNEGPFYFLKMMPLESNSILFDCEIVEAVSLGLFEMAGLMEFLPLKNKASR